MNFQVVWPNRAMESLAATHLAARRAGNAEAVIAAMVEIERELARSPATAGESRGNTERMLVVRPVVVEYEVFTDERVVVVTAARYVRGRG